MYMDFTPAKDAKIYQGEFAKLAGVSRTTANSWYNGKQVHYLLTRKITTLLSATKMALVEGQLPLEEDLPRGQRIQALRTILSRYVIAAKAE